MLVRELEQNLEQCRAGVLQVCWFDIELGRTRRSISTAPFALTIGWHEIFVIVEEL